LGKDRRVTMNETYDEIKELDNKLPIGWFLFFIGVIVWGAYYIFSFTPEISGWKQTAGIQEQTAKQTETPQAGSKANPFSKDPKVAAEGAVIFKDNCAACHGEDLKGGVGPNLTGVLKYGETDEAKFETVSDGRPNGMPAFEQQLGKDRIWKVLAYVDSVRAKGKP
jgi:cytochrome c oxidase cbb3-type subunit III